MVDMSESRPVIGIATALERARYGMWDASCFLLQVGYVRSLQQAGALALMIPPDPALVESPDEILDRLDALVLAGGADIDPASYGAAPHPETLGTVPARDEAELALVRRAIERDLPVLGICRGMQLINIALGGTLNQHLPDLVGHDDHRPNPGSFDGSEHDVRLEPGSLAARVIGKEIHSTKSHHHQGVDALGEGLVISGRSVLDDLPEALEAPENTWVLGVQWHPEADPDSPVVAAVVEEARSRRLARR
jgi:putative glutamine amidotransferase